MIKIVELLKFNEREIETENMTAEYAQLLTIDKGSSLGGNSWKWLTDHHLSSHAGLAGLLFFLSPMAFCTTSALRVNSEYKL